VFANRLRVTATAALLAIAFTVNGSVARAQDLDRELTAMLLKLVPVKDHWRDSRQSTKALPKPSLPTAVS
jgi:hypothetical protein